MSDVVLVHGTTRNAAGFWRLSDALQRYGHRVLAVDVPSDLATAKACADALAEQPPADLHDPVVAAHSTAGLLLPALATRFLVHDATEPATVGAALATVATTDLSALYAELPTRNPGVVASTYLQPTDDRTLTQPAMTAMAHDRLGVQPVLIPGGHNAYVAHPEPIVEAIDAATRT